MRAALALGALAVTGCSGAAPLVTARQLLAQCDAYKGKPVRLAGYLGMCSGFDCYLAVDKARYDAWIAATSRTPIRGHDDAAWSRVQALWPIGVGGDQAFDRKAAPLRNSYVVITGRVAKDTCTGEGGTDRSAGIEPTDIRAWTSSEGAPATTH